VRKINWINNP